MLEVGGIGDQVSLDRQVQRLEVPVDECLLEEWPVLSPPELGTHDNAVVIGDIDKEAIERGVVKAAQREPVADVRRSKRVAIGDNVCGFEKLIEPDRAHRATVPVGRDDVVPERSLVQALEDHPSEVVLLGRTA